MTKTKQEQVKELLQKALKITESVPGLKFTRDVESLSWELNFRIHYGKGSKEL